MELMNLSCEGFLEELASKAAAPGGGGASALVGAAGVALGSMVGSLTVGKKKYAAVEADIIALNVRAEALRKQLKALVQADAEAFLPVAAAYKLPKEKMGLKTMWPIACGMLHNSTLKRLLQFGIAIKRGGASLQDRMDKEKKPYIFVGLVCVREQYQDRAICARLWILPLPRATGWACR